MNTKILSLLVAITLLFASCQNEKLKNIKLEDNTKQEVVQEKEQTVYQKAGIIKLKDPKAVMVGYRQPDDAVFEISLDDVGKYMGHVCVGISSAYILTKHALEMLYPNGEMPARGQISVVASANTDHMEVALYIVRARQNDPESKGENIALVDTSITSGPEVVTLIFKRADNGKMVKAVFNKSRLINFDLKKIIMPLKQKILDGSATDAEKTKFAQNVQKLVVKVITDLPEGVITISECTDYHFPN